ncbi:MAG: carbohydrate-binding family 9-like protein [Blastocatellia bacterium]|nr:carbohydrate-binding family 9-like protein [Blastocatellia bacterium]
MEILAAFDSTAGLTTDFSRGGWERAPVLAMDRDWRGAPAPESLRTRARVLWSDAEILFGFECEYAELDMDETFDPAEERHALWDRDVCEAFIRSPIEPHEKSYREFEVAPTGQWCDLLIDRSEKMLQDWRWKSGMRTAAEIRSAERRFRVAMAIPFEAFGCRPAAGEVWQANLFRIGRVNGERQYLAFSPTFTEVPSFHVPERFVNLRFG